jgi:hypothetical protein
MYKYIYHVKGEPSFMAKIQQGNSNGQINSLVIIQALHYNPLKS